VSKRAKTKSTVDLTKGDPPVSQDEESSGAEQQRAPALKVDESKLIAMYANFCRVTGTPEELIIDFGLNAHPFGPTEDPVSVGQRIVTNYYTAKRLLHALHLTVQRHEAAFGVLETDVQKRVVPQSRQAART
jgi:hypothetical protein